MAIEGFVHKPPLKGTQLVELPIFRDPQPVVEEITSLYEEIETKLKDNTLEEDTKNLVQDDDFEVFYHTNESKEEELSPHLAVALVSKD